MIPTCENLCAALIFLRFYYIVGYAEVVMSLLVVFISFINALLTSVSLSAIVTSGNSTDTGPRLGASIAWFIFMADLGGRPRSVGSCLGISQFFAFRV